MTGVREWWRGGDRVELLGHRVFVRTDGDAPLPWLTLVHGFPTSSYDWAAVVDRLRGRYRLLSLDLLGFGNSDKPAGHRYSLMGQADLVEAAWAAAGVGDTGLAVHDYGVSVGQELLARDAEGRLGVRLRGTAFLNGGMLPEHHRPLGIQRALAHPVSGPLLARLVTERTFVRGLRRVFARPPADAELHEHWLALTAHGGRTRGHALLRYLAERERHAVRWRGAVAGTPIPLRFVWGPLDPISGAHMLAPLRALRPDAAVHELDGIGHYPQIEDPDRVAAGLGGL